MLLIETQKLYHTLSNGDSPVYGNNSTPQNGHDINLIINLKLKIKI